MLKAPVAHDGYGRVAKRLLGWALRLMVLPAVCVTGRLFLSREHQVERRIARQDLPVIQRALQDYRVASGHWPLESSWRENLVAAKLLERPPLDPWGNGYRFRVERSDAGVEGACVISDGPDGVAETADDLRSGP